jgi:aspartate/methionine/tyrosine aminotransferase
VGLIHTSRLRAAGQEGVIGMHGGIPPASVFPLTSLSFTCVDPLSAAREFTGAPDAPAPADSTVSDCTSPTTSPLDSIPADASLALTIDDPAAMAAMQQYNLDFYGHPGLREWLRKLTHRVHTPAREDVEVLLAAGCNGCLDKIIRMFVEEGESILVEESMFSGVRVCSSFSVTIQNCTAGFFHSYARFMPVHICAK